MIRRINRLLVGGFVDPHGGEECGSVGALARCTGPSAQEVAPVPRSALARRTVINNKQSTPSVTLRGCVNLPVVALALRAAGARELNIGARGQVRVGDRALVDTRWKG